MASSFEFHREASLIVGKTLNFAGKLAFKSLIFIFLGSSCKIILLSTIDKHDLRFPQTYIDIMTA